MLIVTIDFYIMIINLMCRPATRLKILVAGFSPRKLWFDSSSVHWDLWWTHWHWDRLLSRYFGFSCQYHCTNIQYSSSYKHCSYGKDKRAKAWNL